MVCVERAHMDIIDVIIDGDDKIYTLVPDNASQVKSSCRKRKDIIEFIISTSTDFRNLSANEMLREFVTIYEDNIDKITASQGVLVKYTGNIFNPNIADFVCIIRKIFYGLRNISFVM